MLCGGGFLAVLILLGLLMGLGRPGGLPRGRLGGWSCLVGLLLAGLVGCLVFGVGDTLSAACVWWWWVPPCVLGACGGGMLSGFWGSAPWLPDPSGLLICCWGLWVGVGGLVVNCIVDASILL